LATGEGNADQQRENDAAKVAGAVDDSHGQEGVEANLNLAGED
jgi:hypothetical protein